MTGANQGRENTQSDEELFDSFLQGDEEGLSALVRRYEKPLFAYLSRYTGASFLAEEIFQETFIKVFEKKHLYDRDMAFRPWLYRIAVNTAKDRFRQRKRDPVSLDEEYEVMDARATPLQEIGRAELWGGIAEAIQRLTQSQREVFLMRQYDGLSYEAISSALDRPLNTVKSDMRRALQRLKVLLRSFESFFNDNDGNG